jgi:hypothetical protein
MAVGSSHETQEPTKTRSETPNSPSPRIGISKNAPTAMVTQTSVGSANGHQYASLRNRRAKRNITTTMSRQEVNATAK